MAFLATPVIGSLTAGNLLTIGGTIMQLVGGYSQADNMREAAVRNAENARRAAEANKQQLDYAAGQEEAAAQHAAANDRRKAALLLSRAQAVAAASGAGPVPESLIAGIVGEGETAAGHTMYSGIEKAKGLRYQGAVGVWEANAKGRQGILEANAAADATIMGAWGKAALSGMSSLAPGPAPTAGGSAYANSDFDTALDFWDYS